MRTFKLIETKKLFFGLLLIAFFNTSILFAQWEPTQFTLSTWELVKADNGNLIAADNISNPLEHGGIYVSEDEGMFWEKAVVDDYSYTSHLIINESIYMGGVGANIAISHDNGETWTTVNFSNLLPGVSENDDIYALELHDEKIYASVYGFGIVYSEDEGVTWSLTDVDSLMDSDNPDNGGEWCNNLRSYQGKLYNIGTFGIWEYNEAVDEWTKIDDQWYAGSSLIVNNVLYVVYNAVGIPSGVRYTTDLDEWDVMALPDDVSTSIRFMKYHEDTFFMGHVSEGIFYSMDHGVTWNEYNDNFPSFSPVPGLDLKSTPMNLVFFDEVMFCGVFSPNVGGVFKALIPEEVLSVNDVQSLVQTVAYPNPARESFNLTFPNGQVNQGSLIITDVLGKIVYSKNIGNLENDTLTINTSDWAAGTYIYSLENGNVKASGKVIIQ